LKLEREEVQECTQEYTHVISQENFHGSNVGEYITTRECDNSGGIATRYGLDCAGIESQ